MIFGFILNVFLPSPLLREILNYTVLMAVLTSLPFTGRGSAVVCLGLFLGGFYLIYTSGFGWWFYSEAIGRNISLLALLITVPLLGLPLRTGGYVAVLDALASKYMRTRGRMYLVPALFSHVLGVFMNIGAVPLTYEITARGGVERFPGLMARSISRGFGAALLWSPNMIATALVLGYLGVPWQNYVHLGIIFAAVSLVAGLVTDSFQREEGLVSTGLQEPPRERGAIDRRKLGQLLVAAVIFLSVVIFIETGTILKVIDIVPVLAVIFPAIWLFLLGLKNTVKDGYIDYFRNRAGRYDGEIVLFVAAGFFSAAVSASGWSEKMCGYIAGFSSGAASLSFIVLALIMITSAVGIHPMVSVSAIAASLDPGLIGLNPVNMALLLITGWSLGAVVSPMSGTNLVVGGLTGKSPASVGIANIIYSVLVAGSVVIYIYTQ